MIKNYLAARIRSFGYAFKGIATLLKTQPHAKLHLIATALVIAAGASLHLEPWEWVSILLCIGLVWLGESLNTAIEFLADEVSLEQRERIGKAKDVAAGGVLIAAIVSISVAAVIFLRHLL